MQAKPAFVSEACIAHALANVRGALGGRVVTYSGEKWDDPEQTVSAHARNEGAVKIARLVLIAERTKQRVHKQVHSRQDIPGQAVHTS